MTGTKLTVRSGAGRPVLIASFDAKNSEISIDRVRMGFPGGCEMDGNSERLKVTTPNSKVTFCRISVSGTVAELFSLKIPGIGNWDNWTGERLYLPNYETVECTIGGS